MSITVTSDSEDESKILKAEALVIRKTNEKNKSASRGFISNTVQDLVDRGLVARCIFIPFVINFSNSAF